MISISQQITDHLKQCHETFDSERLLVQAKAEIDRLTHEMEATKEAARAREAILREALEFYADGCDATETTSCGYDGNMCCMTARAALNGEAD